MSDRPIQPIVWPGQDLGLSERESQVLALCAQGLSNREIASTLFVSTETVRTYVKSVYHQLGITNRAQATSFVYRNEAFARLLPAGWDRSTPPQPTTTSKDSEESGQRNLAEDLGIDEVELGERRRLLGLDSEARDRLTIFAPSVVADAEEFAGSLLAKWRNDETTAAILSDPALAGRVIQHQLSYLEQLFTGAYDEKHVAWMLSAGSIHHRIQLPPQFHLASCSHYICANIPILFRESTNASEAIESMIALLKSVLFDAGLILDAYEMCVERELRREGPHVSDVPVGSDASEPVPTSTTADRSSSPVLRVSMSADEAERRREFIGITAPELTALRGLADVVSATIPHVLEGFYALVMGSPAISALVPDETAQRLMTEVGRYWTEIIGSDLDQAHALSRKRLGVIHERVELSPQFYLAGLARQLSGILRALPRSGANVELEATALIKAAFFDVTFVLDAYMDARANTLVQIGGFATQVVAGLADGVAIVDARNRIEYANERLLSLVGIAPGLLHRLPLADAVPLPGLTDLVDVARQGFTGRATTIATAWGRRLKVTAVQLQRSLSGREGLVAIVFDDISEILRANRDTEHEGYQLDHVLVALNAILWEVEAERYTVLAISRGTERLTGWRDTDLLGRGLIADVIHPDDHVHFQSSCDALEPGERIEVFHRLVHRDGSFRPVRSWLVCGQNDDGSRTISGVTVDRAMAESNEAVRTDL